MVAQLVFLFLSCAIIRETWTEMEVKTVNVIVKKQIDNNFPWSIECHMTSWRPYWCPKTMKRRPCWCPKPIMWDLNSFRTETLSLVPINLHKCWPREWKRTILLINNGNDVKMFACGSWLHLACEQALLFGRARRVSRKRASKRRSPSLARSREARPNRRACSQARLQFEFWTFWRHFYDR